MIFELQDLDKYSFSQLPDSCRDCAWWQGYDDGWPGARQAEAWAEAAGETFGSWGKLALGDDRLLGVLHYGPSGLYPRTGSLACGSHSPDSVLLACGSVAGGALESIRKSLLTAVLAEFKQRGIETVEAYCMETNGGRQDCRFFPTDFLKDCGFYPVRSVRGLKLMRFELGGTQPAEPLKRSRRGLLERIKRRAAAPAPVAMFRAVPKRLLRCHPHAPCSRDG